MRVPVASFPDFAMVTTDILLSSQLSLLTSIEHSRMDLLLKRSSETLLCLPRVR